MHCPQLDIDSLAYHRPASKFRGTPVYNYIGTMLYRETMTDHSDLFMTH